MQLCFAVELIPQHAALSAHRARVRVHVYALHRRQIDHQAVVDRRPPRDVVPSAAYRDLEAERAGQSNGIDDVGNTAATGNRSGMLVDEPVVHPAPLVVGRIGWQ
jgi:hypothetical protein